MSDTTLIYQAILLNFPNDHPAIYQYIIGHRLSKSSAIDRITNDICPIFKGVFTNAHIKNVVKQFLNIKQAQYRKGQIKIKSIY